ncbi:unnamed protein product [Durusdinium trenchii]|uniref:Uncharacterized protein n=1 Tax=Durusdinium trenchii TaxID=1381693 RepID=A0ABP0T172_9DINO
MDVKEEMKEDPENNKKSELVEVQCNMRELGSPGNLKWKDFAEQLQVAFPRRTDLSYLESLELPRGHDPSETFRVSLWQLGFVECCSSKPMTFRVTAAALADEYLTNTCLTAQEPLLLYQQPFDLPSEFKYSKELEGAKRMGLVALLDLPEQCLSLLLQHVSEFGFDGCAFNETAFSNKKPMPGFQPRANSDRAWQKRLAATSEGYELLVRYVHCSHARKPSAIRSKLDTAAMTEATQMSQLLISCLQEIQDQHALPGGAKDKILQDFVDGDNNLELELQGPRQVEEKSGLARGRVRDLGG